MAIVENGAPNQLRKVLAAASGAPVAVLSRAGDELASIWYDARALSAAQRDTSDDGAGDQPAAVPTPSADQVYLAWYAGLGLMGALRLIEWRLAALIAVAHTVERYGHRQRVREFVEGLDAGL